MKKALALLTSFVLLGSVFVGCSGGSSSSAAPAASGAASTASAAGSTAAASTGEGTTINVTLQKHTATDAMVANIADFEESTGIKVNFNILPEDQILDRIQVDLASNTTEVDLVMYDFILTTQFAKAGWVLPLDELATKYDTNMDDFMAGFVDALSYDGTVYGLPVFGESTMLMWNKELFEKAGLSAAPTTKAEFDAACEALDAAGIPAIAMRGNRNPGGNIFIWTGFMLANGGQWFDEAGNITLNSPETAEATQYYSDLLNNYGIEGGANLTWDQVQLAFQQGKVAMAIDATNFVARLENPELSDVVGKVGYEMLPADLCTNAIGCWGMAIPANSPNAEAAYQFMNWALSSEQQLKNAMEAMRADVTRNSVLEDASYIEAYAYDNGHWIDVCKEAINTAKGDYRPRLPEWPKLGDAISVAVSNVTSNTMDAQAALDEAQKACADLTYMQGGK